MAETSGAAIAPARYEAAEPWLTSCQYRFLPLSYLADVVKRGWDDGVEILLYLQSLIDEEVD